MDQNEEAAAPPAESETKEQTATDGLETPTQSRVKVDKADTVATSSAANVAIKSDIGINRSSSRPRIQQPFPGVTSTPKKERDTSITGMRAGSRMMESDVILPGYRKSASRSKMAIGSTISIRKSSLYGETYERGKAARFMNSYKLESDNPFNVEKVEKILQAVMIETLEDLTYDPDKCPKQAKKASALIRSKVKELEFDRYRLVCIVSIGEKQFQDVYVTCRFLWDTDRDRYAKYVHENMHVFGIALCYGIFYE